MDGFSITPLWFDLGVLAPLGLGANQGPALRGALFASLRDNLNVCLHKELPTCQPCRLRQVCPLAGLLATVDDTAPRGHDAPRPMAIQPPLDGRSVYQAGESIRFGVTLFGDGARYVPYLVLAARELEWSGLGLDLASRDTARVRRGGVTLGTVAAVHPLTGAREVVRAPGDSIVRPPTLAVTAEDVARHAATMPTDTIALDLLTPMRLLSDHQLVRPLRFDALVWRLLDRLDALSRYYGAGPLPVDRPALVRQAAAVDVVDDHTRWVDGLAYSSRTGRSSPTGGLVGRVVLRGDLRPFLPWLVWGSLVHVGKSATRGNGWYRVVAASDGVL